MGCRTPIRLFRDKRGRSPTGAWPLVSNPKDAYNDLPIDIPCGRCIYCRLKNSMQKAIRIEHEARYWQIASFITLTYDDEHLRYSLKGVPTLTRGQKGDMTL